MNHRHLASLLTCLSVLFAGCGTLPDARPFADASAALASAVKTSGAAITDSMDEAHRVAPGDKDEYRKLSEDFSKAWHDRIAATEGAAAYANAVADLVAAGNQGSEAAGKVADSLKDLAETAGASAAAPAVGVATEVVQFVFKQIALVRASDKLEKAVAQAQPAVDWIATRIGSESDTQLRPILSSLYKNTASGIKSLYEADDNFAAPLRKKRQAQREAALKDPRLLPGLQELDRAEAAVAPSLQERDRRLGQAAAAYRARLLLLSELSAAAGAWAQAHRDLAAAIKDKRQVNVAVLQQTIGELRDLIKKVGDL